MGIILIRQVTIIYFKARKMNRLFLVLIIFLITTQLYSQQEKNIIPGQLIVQLEPKAQSETLENRFTSINLVPIKLLSKRMNLWLCEYDETKIETKDILFNVSQSQNVKLVQFNHRVQARGWIETVSKSWSGENVESAPNDPRFEEQWALNNTGQTGGIIDADIDAVEAWNLFTGGPSALGDVVVLAIIDGGCDINHEDIDFFKNVHEIPGNGIDDDNNGYVDDYDGWNAVNSNGTVLNSAHGTHVAGISGAIGNNAKGISGVNQDVKIMPIASSFNIESVVVEAYGYVLEMRSRYNETQGDSGAFVVATNASFGINFGDPADYPIWCAIYDSLGMQGILSCCATANGNINIDLEGDVPTACPSDYLVAVTNTTDRDEKNSGSAYGLTTIDLGAPGTNILSTYPGNSYNNLTGTSMATPAVTGAIGLMFAAANAQLMQSYKQDPASVVLLFKQYLLDGTDPITDLQGITVSGGRLNVYKSLLSVFAAPDTTAPTQVVDLAVIDSTSSELTLIWTVPHDTTRNGVVSYDIRYSTSPIIDTNDFNAASPILFGDIPADSGETETFSVDGLDFYTTYYFALKALDIFGNSSKMSNTTEAKTWKAPEISITPDSLGIAQTPSSTYKDTVYLSNLTTHSSTLDFDIELTNNTFPGGSIAPNIIHVGYNIEGKVNDKNNPTEKGGMSVNGFGGPDNYGYQWINSNEPNGPTYEWNDISSSGIAVTNWIATGTHDPKDEGYAGPLPVGFDFSYYGNFYTDVYVSSNGLISFAPIMENTFSNDPIPNTIYPNNIICPFWDDLDGSSQGTVYYETVENTLVIQFDKWQIYPASGSLTFQVVLHSNGNIMICYKNMSWTLNSATLGIENNDGTVGLQAANNSAYAYNGLALEFTVQPNWLISDQLSGRVYNGNTAAIELTFKSEDYPFGNYSMDMVITCNDPVTTEVIIPVTMEIIPVPVELTSFSAAVIEDGVELEWVTATETNNAGFEIEKKTVKGGWKTINYIEGKGSSIVENSYSYYDKFIDNNYLGLIQYRLKQVDYDGSSTYSEVVEIDIDFKPTEYSLEQNYPNLFNPTTKIKYSLPKASKVKVMIYNVLGEVVTELVNKVQESGYYEVNWSAANLSSGVYIYSIEAESVEGTNQFRDLKKMILLR